MTSFAIDESDPAKRALASVEGMGGLLLSRRTVRQLSLVVPTPSARLHPYRQLLYSHWLDCTVYLFVDGSIAFYDCREPVPQTLPSSEATMTPLQRLQRRAPSTPAAVWPASSLSLEPDDVPNSFAILHTMQSLTPAQERLRTKAIHSVIEELPDFVPEKEQPRASPFDVLLARRLAPESDFARAAAVTQSTTAQALLAPAVAHLLRPQARRVWLAIGTRAGRMLLLDVESGQCVEPASQVHSGPISHLCVTKQGNAIFSLGEDSLVQMWHIRGLDAKGLDEPAAVARAHYTCPRQPPAPHFRPMPLLFSPVLEPARRFYLAGVPLQAALMGLRLFILLRDSQAPSVGSAVSLFVFDAEAGATMVHGRADDHAAPVTALAVCEALQIVATADRAGLVKLWREDNTLVKTLDLSVPISAACFLNDGAELLVAADRHLHLVKLAAHLPPGMQQLALSAQQGRDLPWENGDRLEQPVGAATSLSEYLPPDVCDDIEAEEDAMYPAPLTSLRRNFMASHADIFAVAPRGAGASSMSSRLPTRQGQRRHQHSSPKTPTSPPHAGGKASAPTSAAARARSAAAEKMAALDNRDAVLFQVLQRREAAMRNTAAETRKVSRREARRALRELRRGDPSYEALREMSIRYGQDTGADDGPSAVEREHTEDDQRVSRHGSAPPPRQV